MSTSRLWQKIVASAVNCSLVLLLTLPLLPFVPVDVWKMATIATFFIYNCCCRKRCLGMRLVGTFIEPPTTVLYAGLYSIGFSTFFYHVFVPMDLLAANGILQVTSLAMTGNTAHAFLARSGTMSRDDYMKRCKSQAYLHILEGDTQAAVRELIADLNKYKDTALPSYIADLGLVLLKERDEYWISRWIEGIR